MRINRTLLNDLDDVYRSIPCEYEENEKRRGCSYCKNKDLCLTIIYLIHSIEKYY